MVAFICNESKIPESLASLISFLKKDNNASLLSLVESFQNEEERKLMVKMAEMQKIAIKEEASNLESMPDWKARVLGISKTDII